MKRDPRISPLNRRSKRYADGYHYPWHWTTARIRRYRAFIKRDPDPIMKGGKVQNDWFAWYGRLARWMEKGGFK